MANIDVSSIEGFEGMTSEQKVEALLKVNIPDKVDLSGYVSKDVANGYTSEIASLKKQLREKQTDEEAAKADREAKWAEMEAKLEKLEREKAETAYKASYLALGYDDNLAAEAAKAMVEGNTEKVFEIQKQAAEARDKKLKEELIRATPHPSGSRTDGAKSKAVDVAERIGAERAASASEANKIIAMYTTGGI